MEARLHETREAWLNDVAHRMAPIFQQLAAPLPARLRIAGDYKRTNLDQDFPLKAFSEHCYQLRLHDEVAIAEQQFQKELLSMERHKLVVTRQSKGSDEKVKIEWLFRHDKIMEFFIAQTFSGPGKR
jgi:hypothetical protein